MASRSINKVLLLGRLGRDAEVKFTPSGVCVSNFSVATERRWKDNATDEWRSETEWTNVVAWRMESVSNFLLKGTQVVVEGRLQTRKYEKDGSTRYVTEVVADNIILCGDKSEGSSAPVPRSTRPKPNSDDEPPW